MQRLLKPNEVVNAGYVTNSQNLRMDSAEIEPFLPHAENYWCAKLFPSEMWSFMVANRTEVSINYAPQLGPIQIAFPNNANYEALFSGYLYRCIVLAALYESFEAIALKTSALGVNQAQPRNGVAQDFDVIARRKSTIGYNLNMAIKEMLEWLDNNRDILPLWPALKCGETRNIYTFNSPIL